MRAVAGDAAADAGAAVGTVPEGMGSIGSECAFYAGLWFCQKLCARITQRTKHSRSAISLSLSLSLTLSSLVTRLDAREDCFIGKSTSDHTATDLPA